MHPGRLPADTGRVGSREQDSGLQPLRVHVRYPEAAAVRGRRDPRQGGHGGQETAGDTQ